MSNDKEKKNDGITVKQILVIIKEILDVIIAGMPEEKAITQASKKYNISPSVLKAVMESYLPTSVRINLSPQ